MTNQDLLELAIIVKNNIARRLKTSRLNAISHTKLAIQHLEIAKRKAIKANSQHQIYDFDALETMLNALIVILEVTPQTK